MINTNVFDYVNVLDKAADASWLRQQAISNNIANATTPGYKRQDVAFESELKRALRGANAQNMDAKVASVDTSRLNPKPYIDNKGYSYRLDGNSVDPETEQVALVENQMKYQGLTDSINQEFANLQIVMK